MSQERWDVVLRFTSGPLSYQGDLVVRGPVVRMGASPGPGGLSLDGYRGVDDRQAVISAYDGGTVAIAPVGTNQVRVASHEHVDWRELQVLRGPVYLSPGDAFHLGPPGRGVTAIFVEARRLGVWEQNRILSEAADARPDQQGSQVEALDTAKGRPAWFIPSVVVTGLFFAGAILLSVLPSIRKPVPKLGPQDQGEIYYQRADVAAVAELPPEFREGLNEAFRDFIMAPNAEAARWERLAGEPDSWDPKFFAYVTRSVTLHANAWNFWNRLELIKDDYAFVVEKLRAARLPEVFAAIPYQESQYNGDRQSYACAMGWWQFMPETANRVGIEVRDCKLANSEYKWTPTRMITPKGVIKNAEYIDRRADGGFRCRIQGCEVDERKQLAASTDGAVTLLRETWDDPELAESGALVQITILAHNAGYDDGRYEEREEKATNLLPAYRRHIKKAAVDRDANFYGSNITCEGSEWADPNLTNKLCGGVLPNQTQHYAYSIVAQHILAVCYYAQNYGTTPPFDKWRQYVRSGGYCTRINVPSREKAIARGGRG